MDKSQPPADKALRVALGDKYKLWMQIRTRVMQVYPEGRGIRILVPDSSALRDIFSLIDFKLAY